MQADRDSKVDVVDGVVGVEDSADEDSKKPLVSRPPQRRKKAQPQLFKEPSPILEEDVVDGFAILSFKTLDDMEVSYVLFFCFYYFLFYFIHFLRKTKWNFNSINFFYKINQKINKIQYLLSMKKLNRNIKTMRLLNELQSISSKKPKETV